MSALVKKFTRAVFKFELEHSLPGGGRTLPRSDHGHRRREQKGKALYKLTATVQILALINAGTPLGL